MAKRYYAAKEMEMADGGMLKADKSAIANMPQSVKYVEYPKTAYYNSPELYDTIKGVDKQMNADTNASALKRKAFPEKY